MMCIGPRSTPAFIIACKLASCSSSLSGLASRGLSQSSVQEAALSRPPSIGLHAVPIEAQGWRYDIDPCQLTRSLRASRRCNQEGMPIEALLKNHLQHPHLVWPIASSTALRSAQFWPRKLHRELEGDCAPTPPKRALRSYDEYSDLSICL